MAQADDIPTIHIRVEGGAQFPDRFVRGREVIVGGSRDADITLIEPGIADRFLKIVAVDAGFEVHDLTGRHPPRTIQPDDLIRLFGVTLSFRIAGPGFQLPPRRGAQPEPKQVGVADLLQRPQSYDNQHITVSGLWWYGFELSSFADAWLSAPDEWDRLERGTHYVRVTGTWHAAQGARYGHLGGSDKSLVARQIELLPLVPTVDVGPGELAARLASLEGELVGATVPMRRGHRLATIDGIATSYSFDDTGRDPVEQQVRALVWIQHGALTVLEQKPLSEPRLVDVSEVSVDELPKIKDMIVDVVGDLSKGPYWPRLGRVELIPPEFTTGTSSVSEFGYQTPPPPDVVRWQERLADGPIRVRARGTINHKRFSCYRLVPSESPDPPGRSSRTP
jgi:hypothetical protein